MTSRGTRSHPESRSCTQLHYVYRFRKTCHCGNHRSSNVCDTYDGFILASEKLGLPIGEHQLIPMRF